MTSIELSYAEKLKIHEAIYGKLTDKEEALTNLFYGYGFADKELQK